MSHIPVDPNHQKRASAHDHHRQLRLFPLYGMTGKPVAHPSEASNASPYPIRTQRSSVCVGKE